MLHLKLNTGQVVKQSLADIDKAAVEQLRSLTTGYPIPHGSRVSQRRGAEFGAARKSGLRSGSLGVVLLCVLVLWLAVGCAPASRATSSSVRSKPLTNQEFMDALVRAIETTNILNELSYTAQNFAMNELGIDRVQLAAIRTLRIPAALMASMVALQGDKRITQAFFFVRRDAFTPNALKKLGQSRQLTLAQADELYQRVCHRLFATEAFALLVPPEMPSKEVFLARIRRNSCVLHEVYHYHQYRKHNLPVYHSREVNTEIESQAYAFQMQYLASEGLSQEQVIQSFCTVHGLTEKQAARKWRWFEGTDFGRFLKETWNKRVAPRLGSQRRLGYSSLMS